jgi:glycosyltransferase involved in cell wall biosynthesis
LKKTVKELQKKHRFDMVHTRPGIPTLVALWMKKKYGTKFLNDIRGFWADERVDGGMWNLKNPLFKILYRYFKNKEDECIRQADYNTCLTYKAKEIILGWKQVPQPVRISVIPCSVDMKLFDAAAIDPLTRDSFRKELGFINNDFIISYLGSVGGWYLTDEMLRFCALLLAKKPEAKFFFISNNRHADILEQASRHGIPADKILVRSGKRHEVPVLLSFSTYSIFFIKPCFSKLSSSPTKHGEIMAMGIPVITNSGVGDLAEIVDKYQAGYVLPDFSEASMLHIIQSIVAHPHPVNAGAIRSGANAYYNLSDAVQSYASVYRQVLG